MIRGTADRLWWMKIWCRAVEEKIRENIPFTITPLPLHFPQISRSLLHKIVSEVKEVVTTCFASQAATFYDEGIQKLVQRCDKCLNNDGNYVEKWCTVCTSNGNVLYRVCNTFLFFFNSPSELTFWTTLVHENEHISFLLVAKSEILYICVIVLATECFF